MSSSVNNSKGAVVELVLVLVMAIVVSAGVYVYTTQSGTKEEIVPTATPIPTVAVKEDIGTFTTPTPLPQLHALSVKSTDEELNSTAADLNQLISELDGLDDVGSELDNLTADFSLGF